MPTRETVRRLTKHKAWRKQRPGPTLYAGEPATVTFPTTSLRSKCMIALGADLSQSYLTWNWLNITDRVRWDDGIEIVDGRREKSDRVDAALAKLKADNRDSVLSRKNPLGPYFGLLGKAIPIWISLDPGTGFADRFFGFIVDPAKRWDRSTTDSVVLVTARGLLHLLLRRQPLRSPMFYSISGVAEGDFVPNAYWPLEDGPNANQAASGLPGGAPAAVTGDVFFSTAEDLVGSAPLAFLDPGAVITGVIPAYTNTDKWFFQIALRIDESPSVDTTYFEIDNPGGDTVLWRLWIEAGSPDTLWFTGYDSSGAPTGAGTGIPMTGSGIANPSEDDFYGLWWFYTVYAYLDPIDGVFGGLSITDDGDFEAAGAGSGLDTNFGKVSTWRIYGANGVAAGHAAFFSDANFNISNAFDNAAAMGGWDGEMAHVRMARLCREQRISFTCDALTSAVLGPQPSGTLLEVLRDAEKADGGVLHEHQFGLAFQALSQRYDQPVVLTIDVAQGQVAEDLEPDDNDSRYHNQWTARRTDGSSATVQGRNGNAGEALEETDPLYDAEDNFGVSADTQLSDVAGWLVHRDSLEEDYWPNVSINLAAHPELIGDWLAMGYGQRLNVLNVMDQAGIDTIDALREGYTERWNSKEWEARMNTAPASPYRVVTWQPSTAAPGDLDTPRWGFLDSETSGDFVSGTDTSMTLVTNLGPPMTTVAGDLPVVIAVAGVLLEVTAVSGSSSPQTLTITQTPVNGVVRTIPSGSPVQEYRPHYWGR